MPSGAPVVSSATRRSLNSSTVTWRFYLLVALTALLVLVVQMMAFNMVWSALVSYAEEHGRAQRGGVAIGITIYYSSHLLMFLTFVASILGACVRRAAIRWIYLFVFFTIWGFWSYPSFAHHPVRMPALLALGAFTYILGSGLLMPLLGRYLRIRLGIERNSSESR
jgi:hypothetical protein